MAPNSRTTKDPEREARTRAEIISVTRRLVQKHGLRKLTMEDIASALGKKKSFLYYYFPGKREVVHAMVEDEMSSLQATVRAAAEQGTTTVDRFRRYFDARIEGLNKRLASYSASLPLEVLTESGPDVASLLKMRQEFDQSEERFVARLIQQGIKEGCFRPLPARTIEDISYFMFSALRGLEFELILSHEFPANIGHRLRTVLDIFLRGLAP